MQTDTAVKKRGLRVGLAALSIAAGATVGINFSADAGTRNLLTERQQTFENRNIAGWEARDGASVRTSNALAYRGRRAMEIRAGIAAAGGTSNPSAVTVGSRNNSRYVPVRAGATYQGSVATRSGSTQRRAVRCDLVWLRSNGTLVAASPGTAVNQAIGTWQPASCAGTAPAQAVFAQLRVTVNGATSGERHYFDEASVIETGGTQAPNTSNFAFRANAGSNAQFVAASGTTFAPDSGFLGGNVFGGTSADIQRTTDDALYTKHRWGLAGYDVPVPGSGTYTVRLHFAETVLQAPGQRVFDVAAEGTTRVDNLDVFAEVGANAPLVEQFTVNVSDGSLNLRFGAVVEDPMISGVEVLGSSVPAPTPTTAPTTTAPTTAPPTTAAPTTAPPPPPTTAPPPPPTTRPPAPAPSGAFPNASNTGPTGSLTPSGSIVTSANGQVIQNLDINGEIRVNHSNVVIRNVRIRSNGGNAIYLNGVSNLLVEDCELDGQNRNSEAAIGEHNYTMRRCEIHNFGEGPRINGNVTLEDNYIHSFADFNHEGAHQDCIQQTSGYNVVIRHNTCLMDVESGNAALMIGSFEGGNVLVENNLFAGGGYTVYGGSAVGWSPNYTNVTIRNNRFSTMYFPRSGFHGPITNISEAAVSGNVYHESGAAI
jgi:hypothetical protein